MSQALVKLKSQFFIDKILLMPNKMGVFDFYPIFYSKKCAKISSYRHPILFEIRFNFFKIHWPLEPLLYNQSPLSLVNLGFIAFLFLFPFIIVEPVNPN